MKNPQHEQPPQPSPIVQETDFEPEFRVSRPREADQQQLAGPETNINYGSIQPPPPPGSSIPTPAPPPSRARILAPDLLRGLLMALMAIDHTAMSLNAWPHGTAISGETDSTPVTKWNRPAAYILRTLTHLCAPGFTFLLGMGVVYFGRSRTSLPLNLRWGDAKLAKHFLVRGIVLTLVSEVMGLVMSFGRFWVFNIVLISLAVDYVLAGMIWMTISKTEMSLAVGLLKVLPEKKGDDPSEPLLRPRSEEEVESLEVAPDRKIIRAGTISWHVHNVLLVALAVLTIWWNIWLSPTDGYCGADEHGGRHEKLPNTVWVRMWFYQVFEGRIVSGFPPLAWISFAVLGLLYGRIILARSWSAKAISLGNATAGLTFALVFVSTRLFHFGNLSEGCLAMAEQGGGGSGTQGIMMMMKMKMKNQYLASPASFFYLVKYPPDVAFWAFTMAGNHLLLALFSAVPPHIASRAFHVLLVFGTSALFFFVVHMFVAVGLAQAAVALVGHDVGRLDFFTGNPYGVDQLWAVLTTWGLVLAILYPLCRWYGDFKRSKGPDSIWRFF
ncbi:hypothetical protein QBC44DRAFT_326367 [Cladorrhinum sp. PSN332]|nr:hypothetical protein QBC44DRAFT_326367 [Cladorrhinum sp. PSN332]